MGMVSRSMGIGMGMVGIVGIVSMGLVNRDPYYLHFGSLSSTNSRFNALRIGRYVY